MSLITSISGIRGTIGGKPGTALTPPDLVAFAAAYGSSLQTKFKEKIRVVIGRDARPSGEMVEKLVTATLSALGIDVIALGLATTPTVEMEVVRQKAQGGIILTASHNPENWNALKLLNEKGEFLDAEMGENILRIAAKGDFTFAEVGDLGKIEIVEDALEAHIQAILDLKEVNKSEIAAAGFRVAVDGINSVGALAIPALLKKLGISDIHVINAEMNGHFAHNPEPLESHLQDIMHVVKEGKYDMGIVVDPDVDRLAFIDEKGKMFGEEYTLVAVTDYLLDRSSGAVVSNLSSSRALADLTREYGQKYYAAAVGEVNVVAKMKEVKALIGGEGNGGVIFPKLHAGRDALVGVALVLSHLARTEKSLSELKAGYPVYFMSKNKVALQEGVSTDAMIKSMHDRYKNEHCSTIDGLKIDFADSWVHLRKSNTEPIIRIYTEAKSQQQADELAERFVKEIEKEM